MSEPLNPTTQIVSEAPAPAAAFSKTTVAQSKLMQQHLIATKESMIRDMATQTLSDNEVLNNFRIMSEAQIKADNLSAAIAANASPDTPFTEREVEDMRTLKKDHNLTEHQLADLYDSNQTKINRVLNNQTR